MKAIDDRGFWETCELCGFVYRTRELRKVYHGGRQVKACLSCRAKVLEEKLRRERQREIGGQLMW
ncbi:MAG: hypothetical protein AB1563_00200 [Bacillota bacterium]